MAKTAEKAAPASVPAKSGKMTLVLWIVVAVVAGGAGFAFPVLLPSLGHEKKAGDQEGKDSKEAAKPGFIQFGETVVNLNEARMQRYLRTKIVLLVDESQEAAINTLVLKKKPFLKTWLISHLADQSMQEVGGKAGQNRLRREILDQFNAILFPDGSEKIRDILFEEFNVQ